MAKTQRNDPCPCGSGKKYKKCCMTGGAAQKKLFLGGISVRNRYIYASLIIIFALSVFLRCYGYAQPHSLTFDEGLYARLLATQLHEDPSNYSAQAVYQSLMAQGQRPPLPKYLDRPLFKHPPLYCYLIALNYKFFGVNNLSAVSVSILMGSLMILAVFFLGKELYDERVGLLAAFFLCIDPVHWVCSERIWMETTLSFFMLLSILLFALGQKKRYCFLLSGVSIGLAMLTKFPGILSLFIVVSFVLLFDRSLLKKKSFWMLCVLAFLVFLPWIIWSWRAYGNLYDPFIAAHSLLKHRENAIHALSSIHVGFLLAVLFLAGGLFVMRKEIKQFFKAGSTGEIISRRKKRWGMVGFAAFVFTLALVPFLREMIKEAFIWKETVFVSWWNPFRSGPKHFYLTRLSELSPLYVFAFLSFPFLVGKDRGDKLMVWSSLLILLAFILLGNYQSRYILPAVPFLMVLSARWQVWAYDKLTGPKTSRVILRIILMGISVYFIVKTLKVDSLLAIGPDFGYF